MDAAISHHPDGLTVKDLKELIKYWPESDENGEPTTVWVSSAGGVSNVVVEIWPLNLKNASADLLLVYDVPPMPICDNCGLKLQHREARFCSFCGHRRKS
jgi:rRNA maturation endonuclease Nob1